VPDVAEVRCDGDATELVTPFVRPQRDGVHVRLVNEGSREVAYFLNAAGGGGSGGPPGAHEQVYLIPPGRATLACWDSTGPQDPSEIPHEHHLTVIDPEGLFVGTELTGCPDGERFGYVADFAPDAKGEPGDPVDVARAALRENHGLQEADIVERAGYPDEGNVRVRMVRNGEVVVLLTLFAAPAGGWLVSGADGCAAFE
jgi:hypothetical protein